MVGQSWWEGLVLDGRSGAMLSDVEFRWVQGEWEGKAKMLKERKGNKGKRERKGVGYGEWWWCDFCGKRVKSEKGGRCINCGKELRRSEIAEGA